jgi:hypothetical protein
VNWSRAEPKKGKPRWFEPGSGFCAGLLSSLRTRNIHPSVCAFEWSGSNSVLERERVARVLADHIQDVASLFPATSHFIVAHSHGGNIAVKAASLLADAPIAINVAALATPFLRIVEIPAGSKLLKGMAWIQLALSVTLLGLGLLYAYSFAPRLDDLNDNVLFFGVVLAFVILLFSLFGAALIIEIVINPYDGDDYFASWRRRPVRLSDATSTTSNGNFKLLLVRAVGDEASRALVIARAGNKVARRLLRVSVILFLWVFRESSG